jgi:hypothetical protein
VTTRIEASPLVGSDQQLALLAKALGHPAHKRPSHMRSSPSCSTRP